MERYSAQIETERKTKHSKEIEYWLNKTSTSNHYIALLDEESEEQQHKLVLTTRQNLQCIQLELKIFHHLYIC
jgi:hypothetical protein